MAHLILTLYIVVISTLQHKVWYVLMVKNKDQSFESVMIRKGERRDMDLCFFQSLMLKNTHMLMFRVDESAACQIERSDIDDEKLWDKRFEEAQIRLCFLETSDSTKSVYPTEDLIPEHQLLGQMVLRVRREYQQQILILWKKMRHKKGHEVFVEAVINAMSTGCDFAEKKDEYANTFWAHGELGTWLF